MVIRYGFANATWSPKMGIVNIGDIGIEASESLASVEPSIAEAHQIPLLNKYLQDLRSWTMFCGLPTKHHPKVKDSRAKCVTPNLQAFNWLSNLTKTYVRCSCIDGIL